MANFDSIKANLIPTQFRGPCPNGRKANLKTNAMYFKHHNNDTIIDTLQNHLPLHYCILVL